MTDNLLSPAIKLPCLLFATQHKMDDYGAPDMLYGDLSAEVMRQQYHLRDISTHIDPFTHPNREESARILFDEFRDLSDMFSFYGDYKSLARTMITHMQYGNGAVFSDPLLDQAMAEHSSMKQAVELINTIFKKCSNVSKDGKIKIDFDKLLKLINQIRLPKFNNTLDRFNSLGITVHDIWATHIFLDSFAIKNSSYSVKIRFKFQDHFGLDTTDISNAFYRNFRIFRIWFVLQRWEGYGFHPFFTEINSIVKIQGSFKK
ncbi:hypothetical protein B1H58_12930 [Pantoea alhagi]|uniref:DUF3289 domain-containing protein n=1 Tax=Pantoea alhagi TaxID=1891675 RepID=A0A1W6B6Y1_9GAMM|nr:DUF3289 family protein [Pantoea alhagi]ARJ42842.1 hypothetical protein B1H58_12930 [Pantoea alhagi]